MSITSWCGSPATLTESTRYVNNPTTATAEGFALRRPRVALASGFAEAWRFGLRHWGLFAALALTFAVHAPTLRYYFDGDDFVVLGSIEYLGARQYITDTVLMHDIVPNWRPLTGAIYAVGVGAVRPQRGRVAHGQPRGAPGIAGAPVRAGHCA